MSRNEKIELLKKWLESGTSGFEEEKAKVLLSKLIKISDNQLYDLFRLYEKNTGQKIHLEVNINNQNNLNIIKKRKPLKEFIIGFFGNIIPLFILLFVACNFIDDEEFFFSIIFIIVVLYIGFLVYLFIKRRKFLAFGILASFLLSPFIFFGACVVAITSNGTL